MNKEYHFSKFNSFNSRSSDDSISITRSYSLGLSSSFCENNDVNKFKYAVLYYDKDRKSIGIRFTKSESEPSKFTISRKDTGFGQSIIARSFFKKNQVDVNKYNRKYSVKKVSLRKAGIDEPGSLFVVDLQEAS